MYPLLPYPILVLHGIVDFFLLFGQVNNSLNFIKFKNLQPPQILIDIIVNLMVACMAGLVYSTMCMFVFRLLQTTQSRYLHIATDIKVRQNNYTVFNFFSL